MGLVCLQLFELNYSLSLIFLGEACPEEIIVGSEEAVGGSETHTTADEDIPLPTDQDEYTAARPYPCDFCSRRFEKFINCFCSRIVLILLVGFAKKLI